MKSGDQVIQRKGGGTKKSMPETKRVAQNTYSIKFSALQTPRKIQKFVFEKSFNPFMQVIFYEKAHQKSLI